MTRKPLGTFALYEGIDQPNRPFILWVTGTILFGLGLIVGKLA